MIRIYQITLAAPGANADVLTAQGKGPGDAPDDSLEVVQMPGLRARPVVRGSSEALVLELPNGDRFAFLLDKGASDGAVALEAGETQLRGCASAATVVRLRASGDIEVTPATGRNVILAGGTERIARRGDAVRVTIPSGTTLSLSTGGTATTTAPVVCNGTITEGAEHALA